MKHSVAVQKKNKIKKICYKKDIKRVQLVFVVFLQQEPLNTCVISSTCCIMAEICRNVKPTFLSGLQRYNYVSSTTIFSIFCTMLTSSPSFVDIIEIKEIF